MTHDMGPLPEGDRQDSLQQLSLNALRILLPQDRFLIRDERVDDKGVDVALEAKLTIRKKDSDREQFTNCRAQAQLKSTDSTKQMRVYYRQCEGRTELPFQKLSHLADRVAFFAQDERQQRLHAKLVLLEGAGGNGREPFLVTLHGSPNFTTAGLLHLPSNFNAELAVLTRLKAAPKVPARER